MNVTTDRKSTSAMMDPGDAAMYGESKDMGVWQISTSYS